MASNGQLSPTDLNPIPGGRLRNDAARSWNAMRKHIGEKTGTWICPAGPRSSYRSYAEQQYFWNLYQSGRGNLAAHPGTSNHGWGLACDLASTTMRRVIDEHGAQFGWQKRWSDAPSEWWHLKYNPSEDHARPDPKPKPKHPSEYLGPNEAKHRRAIIKTRAELKKHGGWKKNPKLAKKLADEKDALRRSRAGIKKAAKRDGWNKKHRKERYEYIGRLIQNTAAR
jgi:D-alanyl-D-alanine carboxypeptidase